MFTSTEPPLDLTSLAQRNLLISVLLPLSLIHFLSVPLCFHLEGALSSLAKSGIIRIGEGNELLFDKSSVAS